MPDKSFVHDIFTKVANKYDLMNDLMSLGLHIAWKKKAADLLRINQYESKPDRIIDLAGGTGDMARLLVDRGAKNVIVADINLEMIEAGKKKDLSGKNANYIKYITWLEQDAENMDEFEDEYFTHCTMTFGIRNVSNIPLVLNNIARVLSKDGQFLCMEFCPPQKNLSGKIHKLYLDNILPFLGKTVAQNTQAYEYLADSICQFPDEEKFISMLNTAGFKKITVHHTFPMVATIYLCSK